MAKKEKPAKTKKSKPAAAKKSKKKDRGDGIQFKELLAQHFEKGLLGLAVLLTLLIVWSGFSARQGIEPNKTPAALNQEVAETETLVKSYTWDQHFRDTRVDNQDFRQRADMALRPLDAEVYATNKIIRPPVSPPLTKRKDPDLFAATDLQVRAGFGILDKTMSNRGERGRPGRQGGEVFDTEQLQEEALDEDAGRPMPGSTQVGEGRGRSGAETEGIYFASVTGLVPVRKQLEDYQAKLANSRGHSETRDVPIYTNWVLERSEVDASGNAIGFEILAEGRSRRTRRGESMPGAMRMPGEAPETVHPEFLHPLLTSDPPAVEVRDPQYLFVHDRIAALSEMQFQKDRDRRASRWRDRGNRRGGRRPDGGGDPGMGDSRMGDFGMDTPSGGDYQGGEQMREPRFGSDRESGGMQQAPQTGLRAAMPLDEAPEFYMFRYVDRNVEVGRTYRYRLQLVLDDPNNSRFNKPSPETLEPDVAARVMSSRSSDRPTEFSAESAPLEILPGQQLLLAKSNPGARTVIRNTGQSVQKPGAFPSAQVMALIFDAARSTDIPGSVQVSPGAAVCFVADTEIPLWDRSFLKKEKAFKFRTDFDVLDIRGGDEADKVKVITEPGEILVRDPTGRIRVIRELDDQQIVAKYTFPKEEPDNAREGTRLEGGREGDGRDRPGEGRGGDGNRRAGRG